MKNLRIGSGRTDCSVAITAGLGLRHFYELPALASRHSEMLIPRTMEFKGWVTDHTRCSFQGLTVNDVMKFIGNPQKMVPNEFHQYIDFHLYIDWNKTRTEPRNWPTKMILKL